ncbi:MAG: hypothetical protein ABI886_13940 [Betaproteobacteria bacterium]
MGVLLYPKDKGWGRNRGAPSREDCGPIRAASSTAARARRAKRFIGAHSSFPGKPALEAVAIA